MSREVRGLPPGDPGVKNSPCDGLDPWVRERERHTLQSYGAHISQLESPSPHGKIPSPKINKQTKKKKKTP